MQFVIGVDSGGSKTRALAIGIDGVFAGYGEGGGGNPSHDSAFHSNIQTAIRRACANLDLANVTAIVSGIAGLDSPKDHEWAERATDLDGKVANRLQINDVEIAMFGALEGRPGIACVQGAGSMVLAKTESGRLVRNYDLCHYANSAAPKTGFRATHALLVGEAGIIGTAFAERILNHWKAESVADFRDMAACWVSNFEESRRTAGRLAPLVTAAAEEGNPVAIRICSIAAAEITEAILLLGPYFASEQVDVALCGGCGTSPAVSEMVTSGLASNMDKLYRVILPSFTPVEGAVLWALELANIELSANIKANLRQASATLGRG